jgi:hypothetical protein
MRARMRTSARVEPRVASAFARRFRANAVATMLAFIQSEI